MTEENDRRLILDSLGDLGTAAEVELQARTLLSLEKLRRALKELAADGLVKLEPDAPDAPRQFGGLVGLTPKGLKRGK